MRGFGNNEFLPIGLIGLIAPYSEVLLCGCWLWNEIAYLYLRFAESADPRIALIFGVLGILQFGYCVATEIAYLYLRFA